MIALLRNKAGTPSCAGSRTGQLAAVGLSLLLALAAPYSLAGNDSADRTAEREALEQQLDEVRSEIEAIRDRLEADLAERDNLATRLGDAERAVGEAERARRETGAQIAAVDARIKSLDQQQNRLEGAVAESAARLGRQLGLAYRQGSRSRLKLVLDQDDPRRINRQLAYHGYLSRSRIRVIDQLSADMDDLRATRASLAEQREVLEDLSDQQLEEIERRDAARTRRAEVLSEVEQRIASREQALETLERDAAELSQLINELATALADIPPDFEVPPVSELRGQLPRPVDSPVKRRFGETRRGDVTWTGWLFDAPAGTDVQAIAHGRVAYADWLRGYGLILILDHGEGVMSLYAQNESLLRDVGDWVSPGEVIASVGASGGTGDDGLYFELRAEGRPVDPRPWLVDNAP